MINKFDGKFRFLSNFWWIDHQDICDDMGISYPTVEHYFQAQKTIDKQERIRIAFIPKDKAGKAKRQGRILKSRSDWEDIKIDVMKKGLEQKFASGHLRVSLLLTKPHRLIEGNYWHDNFWGNCTCEKCKNIPGKNWLGRLLMEIRDKEKICLRKKSI